MFYMFTKLEIQSEDVTVKREVQQVQEFADDNVGTREGYAGIKDDVVEDIDSGDYELGEFLKRPVRIYSTTIPQGQAFTRTYIQPWYDYFNTTTIRNKLNNYSYIQCDLKIKVVVNSTPFVYGCYMLSYQPLTTFATHQDLSGYTDENLTMAYSQRSHILLESHKNKGGEMTLPFFYHKNWLQLTASETQAMGTLTLQPLAAFDSANGLATNGVQVLIYAWAENVKLAGNTVDLAIQSGDDEYGKGPISGVASVVAGAARLLTNVPIIGRFAKATEIGASAVSGIASLFGFTDVPVIEDVKPLKNTPFHGFASSEIGVPMEKLTLDPKNELTVDPSIAGLVNEDELAISYIAKRPSWLTRASWDQSDVVDTSILKMNVVPTWCRTISTPPEQSYIDSPMGYISRLFSNWRGDLMVKIQIVRSPYHQGRLRVTYDPTGDIYSDPASEGVTNTKIIDIATSDCVEFRIPWMAPTSYLRIPPTVAEDFTTRTGTIGAYDSDYHNGRFEVRVLNPLTGPDVTAGVKLLVWVYAADNFELANPSDVYYSSSVFEVQTGDEDDTEHMVMGTSTSRPNELNLVNFGEDIRSLRTLMRRMTYHMTAGYENDFTATASVYWGERTILDRNIYPIYYGYDPNSLFTQPKIVGAGVAPANLARETPYTWMSVCFVGQRGSMNYAIDSVSPNEFSSIFVARHNETISARGGTADYQLDNPNRFAQWGTGKSTGGVTGACLTNERTQTGVQFVVPFMNKFRFQSTSPSQRQFGEDLDDSENNNFKMVYERTFVTTNAQPYRIGAVVEEHHAIGVDYTPLYFLNVPVRWLYTVPLN